MSAGPRRPCSACLDACTVCSRSGKPDSSTELKNVLDAASPALQYLLIGVKGIPACNERAHGLGPALPEETKIVNGSTKGLFPRIHRPQNDLILQDHIPHDAVCLDLGGALKMRDSREDKDAVGSEHLHHAKGQLSVPDRLIDHINLPHQMRKFSRSAFAGEVGGSNRY